jgi:hypothetical protein
VKGREHTNRERHLKNSISKPRNDRKREDKNRQRIDKGREEKRPPTKECFGCSGQN